MDQPGPGLEQRLSDLQAQIDQLVSSLRLWRQREDHLQPAGQRLLQLTDRCAEILEQWTAVGARHAEALGEIETRLSGLNALETRVQHDASERVQDLQRSIEHEWTALRQLHEEPARQLRQQAASLADVSVAAATSLQRGLERAEARLALLESDLHRSMAALSRDVQTAVAELRLRSDRQPWPPAVPAADALIEDLSRFPSESPRSSDVPGSVTSGVPHGVASNVAPVVASNVTLGVSPNVASNSAAPSRSSPAVDDYLPSAAVIAPSESFSVLSGRLSSLEKALTDAQNEIRAATERSDHGRPGWRTALIALALVAAGAAALVWQLQRQLGISAARVVQAERQARIAADAADRQQTSAREEASRQIAAARDTAIKAQLVSDVLAAPDTVRYILTGANPAARVFAQVLWSRSRGFVFSGSRIPPPPEGATYQIWLTTSGEPVSAGVFVPDASGRITIATDSPPAVPRPVIDVKVTIEPDGGRQAPSGDTLLARAAPRPAAQ